MSETTTTSPAPAPPTTELAPNTVIHAPEPAAPASEAAPPPAPAVPQDYQVNILENGNREVILNSGQKYTGTLDEVVNELAKAQYHASKRITELGQQTPQPTTPPAPQSTIDPTAKALADLTAQGMGYANSEEYMADLRLVRGGYEEHQNQQIAQQFLAATPDFPKSQENADKIDQTLASLGLPATLGNLQVAHHYLKGTGQYVQVNSAPAPIAARPGMPLPPNGSAAPQSGPLSDADVFAMPMAEVEKLYRSGR